MAAGGSGADAEACSDRLVGVPCLTHALGGLLLGFRQPENEDDGEEEDDRPPGEKASHGCKSCVMPTGALLPCRLQKYSTNAVVDRSVAFRAINDSSTQGTMP